MPQVENTILLCSMLLTYVKTKGMVEQRITYNSQCHYLSYAPASCKLIFYSFVYTLFNRIVMNDVLNIVLINTDREFAINVYTILKVDLIRVYYYKRLKISCWRSKVGRDIISLYSTAHTPTEIYPLHTDYNQHENKWRNITSSKSWENMSA